LNRAGIVLSFFVNNPLLQNYSYKSSGLLKILALFEGFEREIILCVEQQRFACVAFNIATSLLIGKVLGALDAIFKKTPSNGNKD